MTINDWLIDWLTDWLIDWVVSTDERAAYGLRLRDRAHIQSLFFVKWPHSSVSVGIQFLPPLVYLTQFIFYFYVSENRQRCGRKHAVFTVRNKVVFCSFCHFRPSTRAVVTPVEDLDGTPLTKTVDQLKKWASHFEQ